LLLCIDFISEENGVDQSLTRIDFFVEDFLLLINNKEQVLKYKRE